MAQGPGGQAGARGFAEVIVLLLGVVFLIAQVAMPIVIYLVRRLAMALDVVATKTFDAGGFGTDASAKPTFIARLIISCLLSVGLLFVLYLLLLARANASTFLILGAAGIVIAGALVLISEDGSRDSSGFLEKLQFWDD